MSTTIHLSLPDSAFSALRRSPEEFVDEMRLAAAMHWYSLLDLPGELSVEYCSRLPMSRASRPWATHNPGLRPGLVCHAPAGLKTFEQEDGDAQLDTSSEEFDRRMGLDFAREAEPPLDLCSANTHCLLTGG